MFALLTGWPSYYCVAEIDISITEKRKLFKLGYQGKLHGQDRCWKLPAMKLKSDHTMFVGSDDRDSD